MARRRHPQLDDRAWLEREYADRRKGAGTIAQELGIPKTTFYDALRRHEIKLRRPGVPESRDSL